MMYYIELLQSPAILRAAAVPLVLLLAIALLVLVARQRRCLRELSSMSVSLSHLHEGFIRTNLSLESTANKLQNLEEQSTVFLQNYEHSKAELTRMAEAMGGESQLTKAIDLARGGADAKEITLTTGLSDDDANAIVKSHGSSKR
jgi:hypothetical protein